MTEKQVFVQMDNKELAAFELGRRIEREACAKVVDVEADRHKEAQHEHTGLHGEVGLEAMMARASVWACEAIAAAIRSRSDGVSE